MKVLLAVIDATAPARAPSEPVKSPSPAKSAEACRAPYTLAVRPPIPERVATAERIRPRLALLIVPEPARVADRLTPRAPEPDRVDVLLIPTLLPTPPDFGGNTQA